MMLLSVFDIAHPRGCPMVDPVTLATVTSAVTTLGLDIAKQVASDATKALWGKVKSLLGWTADPPPDRLAVEAAKKLAEEPELVARVNLLLKAAPAEAAGQLVGSIDAEKVVVAGQIHAQMFTM
jgi:hypothetical protein